jgi:hypothetical protein
MFPRVQEEARLRILYDNQLRIVLSSAIFDGVELHVRDAKLCCDSKGFFIQLPLGIDVDIPHENQRVEIRTFDGADPTLQFLVVWIRRLRGRLTDMLAEAHMPGSSEAGFAQPANPFESRATLIRL